MITFGVKWLVAENFLFVTITLYMAPKRPLLTFISIN